MPFPRITRIRLPSIYLLAAIPQTLNRRRYSPGGSISPPRLYRPPPCRILGGGGAGIQADLRTFAFHCVHGTSAITCVTAQNTLGVSRVDALPAEAVIAQIEAVVGDIGVQATKTGMLLNREIKEKLSIRYCYNFPIWSIVRHIDIAASVCCNSR